MLKCETWMLWAILSYVCQKFLFILKKFMIVLYITKDAAINLRKCKEKTKAKHSLFSRYLEYKEYYRNINLFSSYLLPLQTWWTFKTEFGVDRKLVSSVIGFTLMFCNCIITHSSAGTTIVERIFPFICFNVTFLNITLSLKHFWLKLF